MASFIQYPSISNDLIYLTKYQVITSFSKRRLWKCIWMGWDIINDECVISYILVGSFLSIVGIKLQNFTLMASAPFSSPRCLSHVHALFCQLQDVLIKTDRIWWGIPSEKYLSVCKEVCRRKEKMMCWEISPRLWHFRQERC